MKNKIMSTIYHGKKIPTIKEKNNRPNLIVKIEAETFLKIMSLT